MTELSHLERYASRRSATIVVLLFVALASPASAAVDVQPSQLTVVKADPYATSSLATATITFPAKAADGTGALQLVLPAPLVGKVGTVPAGLQYSFEQGDTQSMTSFRFAVALDAPTGSFAVKIENTQVAESDTVTLKIEPPEFDFAVEPRSVQLPIGGSATIRVSTAPGSGFSAPIVYRILDLPAGVLGGDASSVAPPYPALGFVLQASTTASAGTYRARVRAAGDGRIVERALTIEIPAASFAARIDPDPVRLRVGGPEQSLIVSTLPQPGWASPVTYALEGLPAFVAATPPAVSSPPGFPAARFGLRALAGAAVGTYPIRVRGSAAGAAGPAVVTSFTLIVDVAQPRILEVAPRSVATGSRTLVRLRGESFEPGARVTSTAPGVGIGTTRVISPTLAEVEIDVRPEAVPFALRLDLVNPTGASTDPGASLIVVAADSPAAPLGVSVAAIVSPLPGTHLGDGEELRPSGLLATTGTGTILGSWRLDGVPYERFSVSALAGRPVAVEGRLPIPRRSLGRHRLELVIDQPLSVASPAVDLLFTTRTAGGLRLVEPPDQGAIGAEPPVFRWTPVPGAIAYRVEIEHGEGWQSFRVADNLWRPSPADRARIGDGARRWRVLPLLTGDSPGAGSEASLAYWLPAEVDLEVSAVGREPLRGGLQIRWRGGAPGAIYWIEFLDAAGAIVQSAVTRDLSYALPAEAPLSPTATQVRVSAFGPRGEMLGRSPSVTLRAANRGGSGARFASQAAELALFRREPEPDGHAGSRVRIAADWPTATDAGPRLLQVDEIDCTPIAAWRPDGVDAELPFDLPSGEHHVRLLVGGREARWQFTVREELAAQAPAPGSAAVSRSWTARLEAGSARFGGDGRQPDELHAGLSVEGALGAGATSAELTGDATWARAESQGSIDLRNDNWLLAGRRDRLDLRGGYGAPRFLSGLELVAPGVARGGVEGSVGTERLRMSYFRSFDPALGAIAGGGFAPRQDLDAAALEWRDPSSRIDLRLVGIEAREGSGIAGASRETRNLGLLAAFEARPGMRWSVEAAHGETAATGAERRGVALGVALQVAGDGLDWAVKLRHVDADFANLANPGMTDGGRSNRDSLDFDLRKSVGGGAFTARAAHVRGAEGLAAGARVTALRLGYDGGSTSLRYALEAEANRTRSEADEPSFVPAVERDEWGLSLRLEETLGALRWGQALSHRVSDDASSGATITTSCELTVQGSRGPLQLAVGLGGSRVDAAGFQGRTDSWTLSAQPSLSLPRASLRIDPHLAYSRSRTPSFETDLETQQVDLRISWTPPWLGSLVAIDLASGWSRQRDRQRAFDSGFDQRHQMTLVLRWGASRPEGTDQPLARLSSPQPTI